MVIALSLMAFVLLLLLSITTLVQVETQSSAIQVASMRAKQNALLGLNIALGELQRTTGPDQRVTARADMFDSNPSTLDDEGVENPFWLGVYKTVEVGSETQPLEALRTWTTDRTQIDRVDWLVSSRRALDGSIDPVATDVVTLNGGNTADVATLATYNDNSGNLVPVQAGKIDVLSGSGAVDGRYSWWVADENAKFRINATRDDTVLVNGQPFEPRWSVMAPHQSNPSIISALSSFDVTDATQRDKLKRAYSAESVKLVDPAWSTWVKENGGDFTVVSQSIPVDVTQGRLKEDLTVYLETDASGLSDTDHIVRGSSDEKPNHYEGRFSDLSTQIDYDTAKLPKFGLIKSWYEAGSEIEGFSGGTPPAPRSHEVDQHGLHPVILRTAVYLGLSFEIEPSGTTRLVHLIYPKFVLWNPHNVPIAPAKYVVQVRAQTTLNTQIDDGGFSFAATNVTQGFNYQGNIGNVTSSFSHFNWSNNNPKALKRNPNEGKYQISSDDEFPYLTFVIDNDGFAPGETLLYTAKDKHSDNPDSEYVNTNIKHFESNFSTSAFNDHNILANENEGSSGFFYIVSNEVITPVPATAPDPPHVTDPADQLEATLYLRDTTSGSNAPMFKEPSLTAKLYHVDSGGELKLLEFIDLSTDDLNDTTIDWEHINDAGQQSEGGGLYDPLTTLTRFRSKDVILDDPFLADYIRGHGFVTSQMGGNSVDKMRLLARHNLAVPGYHRDDPLLLASVSSSRMHEDAIPAHSWFNGTPFPSDIPKEDGAYKDVAGDGYDTLGGYGLHVNNVGFTTGNTVYPLYDSVRSETGLLSLGFLKNVNFGQWYWQPSFSFGNSEAHTHVARNAVQETHGGVNYTDLSYLLNESLWDRFFVSTIPQDSGTPVTENTVLPNGRNRLVANSAGIFPDAADLRSSIIGFEQAAASVVVEGGFNVNSTSVDAWRMFLASHLGESVLSAEDSPSNDIGRAPITSRAFPILAEAAAVDVASPQTWSALRSLTEAEIDLLATAMVEEVKLRGPFLSMADFVNRRLVADGTTRDADFLGLKGTLQAAIDKTSTSPTSVSLNNTFYIDAELTPTQAPGNTQYPEHETGMPSGESGSTMFGAPGFLTQADVLAGLGSLMTVRGDTFTIRTYGESLAGISGNIESKAWCEAVVQRIAEPVDVADSIINPTGNLGRQYKVLSLRWLDEREVL